MLSTLPKGNTSPLKMHGWLADDAFPLWLPGVPFSGINSAGKFQGGSNAPLEGWLGSCTFRG